MTSCVSENNLKFKLLLIGLSASSIVLSIIASILMPNNYYFDLYFVVGAGMICTVYFVFAYKKHYGNLLIPIAVFIMALEKIIMSLRYFASVYFVYVGIIEILLFILLCASIFSNVIGHTNKVLKIISFTSYALTIIWEIINTLMLEPQLYDILHMLSIILLFGSILIYNLLNKVEILIPFFAQKEQLRQAKERLQLLKDKYELGIISYEDYQHQIQEISTK